MIITEHEPLGREYSSIPVQDFYIYRGDGFNHELLVFTEESDVTSWNFTLRFYDADGTKDYETTDGDELLVVDNKVNIQIAPATTTGFEDKFYDYVLEVEKPSCDPQFVLRGVVRVENRPDK